MIRDALQHYPFVSLALVALLLFVGAYAKALFGTWRVSGEKLATAAHLPLEEDHE